MSSIIDVDGSLLCEGNDPDACRGLKDVYEEWIDPSYNHEGNICVIHRGVPLDPVSHSNCDGVFCRSCIQEWRTNGRTSCPCCRAEVESGDDYETNVKSKLECDSIPVGCPASGCEWTGTLAEGEAHFLECAEYTCSRDGCGWTGTRMELSVHSPSCPYRPVVCTCGRQLCFSAWEEHQHECPDAAMKCPKCSVSIKRCDYVFHKRYNCPEEHVPCLFQCEWQGERKRLSNHNNSCVRRPVLCQCHQYVIFMDLEVHVRDNCTRTLVLCDLCSQEIERGLLVDHKSNECPEGNAQCAFSEYGCSWTGLRKTLEDHHSACECRGEECQQCGDEVPLKHMEDHVENVCIYTIVSCPHCSLNMERQEMWDHKRYSCPNAHACCAFAGNGCSVEMHRDLIEEHERECPFKVVHERLSLCDGIALRLSHLNDAMANQTSELNSVKSDMDRLHARMNGLSFALGKRVSMFDTQLSELFHEVKRLKSAPLMSLPFFGDDGSGVASGSGSSEFVISVVPQIESVPSDPLFFQVKPTTTASRILKALATRLGLEAPIVCTLQLNNGKDAPVAPSTEIGTLGIVEGSTLHAVQVPQEKIGLTIGCPVVVD